MGPPGPAPGEGSTVVIERTGRHTRCMTTADLHARPGVHRRLLDAADWHGIRPRDLAGCVPGLTPDAIADEGGAARV